MKTTLFSVALLGTLVLASCEKIKDAIFPSFEQDIPEVTVTIPITTSVGSDVVLGAYEFKFNVDSLIRKYTAQQFGIDNAGGIQIKSVILNLNNEDNLNNFSNFENVKLSVSSDEMPVNVTVAETAITSGASPLVVPGNNTDLKKYFKSGRVIYTLTGRSKKITTKPLQMSVQVQLKIN
jgi:hypothetical protein